MGDSWVRKPEANKVVLENYLVESWKNDELLDAVKKELTNGNFGELKRELTPEEIDDLSKRIDHVRL